MPERTSGRKVLTPIQGEDAWVIIRAATVGEILQVQQATEIREGFWYKIGVLLGKVLKQNKQPTRSDTTREFAYRIIGHINEWNWVDEHGEPLPQPADDPHVVEQLTEAELAALVDAVYRRAESEEQKN